MYRPQKDPDCLKYWPDAKHGKYEWYRFLWVEKDTPPQIKIWAYRYVKLVGRLYWKEEWLGTRSNLFPWSAVIKLGWLVFIYFGAPLSFLLIAAFFLGKYFGH